MILEINKQLEQDLFKHNFTYEEMDTELPIVFTRRIKTLEKIANKHGFIISDKEYDEQENDYICTLERK